MASAINPGLAVSNVDATRAPAGIGQKMKSIFSKVVKELARAMFIPETMRHAQANHIPRVAVVISLIALGPMATNSLVTGITAAKKLFAKHAIKGERQPLLLGKEKSL